VERRHIIPAAIRVGIGRIGWHSSIFGLAFGLALEFFG